jgi:hypothetical protein
VLPITRAISSVFRRFGADIVRYEPRTLQTELRDTFKALHRLRELAVQHATSEELAFVEFCCANYRLSESQLFQDLFVLRELNRKPNGYFVEFGATDGVALSNTYLLEKHFGWRGLLAEPARRWQEDLRRNRACTLDFRCVWDKSGEVLEFNEVADAELSTVNALSTKDLHAKTRQNGVKYPVNTVSLEQLLQDNHAPPEIDYPSLDTEGSEFRGLSAFDFSRYRLRVITVEHNYTPDRERIHSPLSSNGFVRKFATLSFWDDWYIASTA